LTDAAGRFFIRAPRTGVLSVRAELIGHESAAARVTVNANVVSVNIALPIAAVKLEALQVSGERRCTARPERGRETARVWDEARKALTVASWTEKGNQARFEVRSFERVLEPRTFRPLRESYATSTQSNRPYGAVSADTLAQYGFVRAFTRDSVMFFGPDADVLLSDAFLDTHCFWIRAGEKGHGLIGLAFEPVPSRKLRDITGTLWVDLRSGELKFIEFHYTNLDPDMDVAGVGGRTDFRRMPSGAWVVDRWYIRLPALASTFRGFKVRALIEAGGEILSANVVGSAVNVIATGHIDGVVYDSIRGTPRANAIVYLSGTSHRTVTDSLGRFTIDNVTEGDYNIAFWHASLDSLPALPEPRALSVAANGPFDLTLAVPSLPTLIERACGAMTGGGVLVGYTRDRAGDVVPEARLKVSYQAGGRLVEIERASDRIARFILCELPLDTDIAIRSDDGPTANVRIGSARFARKDVVVSNLARGGS
jgi:hypothetical protein